MPLLPSNVRSGYFLSPAAAAAKIYFLFYCAPCWPSRRTSFPPKSDLLQKFNFIWYSKLCL